MTFLRKRFRNEKPTKIKADLGVFAVKKPQENFSRGFYYASQE